MQSAIKAGSLNIVKLLTLIFNKEDYKGRKIPPKKTMPKKARSNRDREFAVIKELESVRKRYQSLEKMAEDLQQFPGFSNLNKATISRWKTSPSPRTELALSILNARREISPQMVLRIAEPRSLWSLPSSILSWEGEEKSYGLPEEIYNIRVEPTPVDNGTQGLDLLKTGSVNFSLFAPEFSYSIDSSNLVKLCNIVEAPLVGLASSAVRDISKLMELKIAIPEGSILALLLEREYKKYKDIPPNTKFISDVNGFVKFLSESENNAVIAWEPLISEITVKAGEKKFRRIETVLPRLTLSVWANKENTLPLQVLYYLQSLLTAARFVEEKKRKESFHQMVAGKLGMGSSDVKKVLETTIFNSPKSDLEILSPILAFWEYQIIRKNQ